ncbi:MULTISPECIES: DUF4172 domain-containing protein [Mesorhizobium]|uniref:DUF4172 domain-containing protein n=1 Tax=Mesorhizobium TaxID=68287 RepID=UPI00319E3A1F
MDWSSQDLAEQLAAVRLRQGRLLGRMDALGFDLRAEAVLQTLTEDVLKSSEIEGEVLDKEQVRSSIARRLGIDIGALAPVDRRIECVVEMMLDATQNYTTPLTDERLFAWHAALFPTGRSGMTKIIVGAWRNESSGSHAGGLRSDRTRESALRGARREMGFDAWRVCPYSESGKEARQTIEGCSRA